jgi:ABC-type Na+ efflux pump permease subunit
MSEAQAPVTKSNPWYSLGTALTILLSVVICVTGVMLFLKIGVNAVKEAHEWLSLVFVAAVIAHAIRNRRPILRYAKVRSFWVATVIVIAATAFFVLPSIMGGGEGGHGGSPMMRTMEVLGNASVAQIAAIMKTPENDLVERLRAKGFEVPNAQIAISELATKGHMRPPDLFAIMLP